MIKVTNDLIFQRIFGKVGNEHITKSFLEEILGIEIEELTLNTNKRLIGNEIEDKIPRLDVRVKLKDGTKVIIEMQSREYGYMLKRLVYYWARVYSEGLKRGNQYDELKKTIAILIIAENLEETKETEKYHTIWKILNVDNQEMELTDDFEIHIIELKKFKEEEAGPESDWIRFLKGGKMEEEKEQSPGILAAIEELNKIEKEIEKDPEMQSVYDAMELDIVEKILYRQEGYDKGKEEGIKKAKQEIIFKMHKKGMSIKEICDITELNVNQVKQIIEEEQNN